MSILKFCGNEWAGVIEMGANHVGEIHELSLITKPDIAVITNIGYGHVGLFGSIENTCKAKFEIADGLSRGGFLLLNGDDPRLVKGVRERGLAAEFYGLSSRCSVRPENLKVTPDGLSFDVDGSRYSLQMPGRHFVCRSSRDFSGDAAAGYRKTDNKCACGSETGIDAGWDREEKRSVIHS